MSDKTLPLFPSAFSRLAEAAALKLRVEQTRAFNFSEQTAKALSEARQSPSPESLAIACQLAASELEGSRELAEVSKTLSLCFALPVASRSGKGRLAYPLFGVGLAKKEAQVEEHAALVDMSRLGWAREDWAPEIEIFDELRVSSSAPPLARAMWDALRDARESYKGEWLSASAPRGGPRPIQRQYSSEMALEDERGHRFGYHSRDEGDFDPRPLTRALGAQAEMMSRLLGEEPGPQSTYERARHLVQNGLKNYGMTANALSSKTTALGQAWEFFFKNAVDMDPRAIDLAQRLQPMANRLAEGEPVELSGAMAEAGWVQSVQEELSQMAGALGAGEPVDMDKAARAVESAFVLALAGDWPQGLAGAKAAVVEPFKALQKQAKALAFKASKEEKMGGSDEQSMEARWGGEDAEKAIERVRAIFLLADRWGQAQEEARSKAAIENEKAAREGAGELFEVADTALLAAAEIAKEREIAALSAMGLEGAAKALRASEDRPGNSGSHAPKMASLKSAQEIETLKMATDPLKKMLMASARLASKHAYHGHRRAAGELEGEALERHMLVAASKEELEAFCKSAAGAFYIKGLESAVVSGEEFGKEGVATLYMSCLQEFRSPSAPGEAIFEEPWAARARELVMGTYYDFAWADSDRGRLLKPVSKVWEAAGGGSSENWSMAIEALGEKEGLRFVDERARAAVKQCPAAARHCMDKALGKPTRDPAPIDGKPSPLKKGKEYFWPLPYGFADDEKVRAFFGPLGGAAEEPSDTEVLALLKTEGFAGEMAIGAQSFYQSIETRPDADARSRANAWLAAGKRLCKEELGMSDAGYRLAKEHAGAGKRVAGMLAPILKERQAARAALEAPLKEAKTRSLEFRRARRLTRLLGMAAARGLGPEAAFVASEALTPGKASSGELELTPDYVAAARAPMRSGASCVEVVAALRRETTARRALETRFDAALLDRAAERLGDQSALDEAARAKAEKATAKDLKAELELVEDWANDSKGSFFSQLDPKLTWVHLRRGQEAWHEEVQKREAKSGSGWKAALGAWSDPKTGWSAQELLTPTALSDEGKAMRHCVGGYSSQCSDGSSRIFSLKKNGIRALTAQFDLSSGRCLGGELPMVKGSWRLKQNKGPCNAEPTHEGAAATAALAQALQNGWDARVEKALAERPEVKEEPASADIPGFNPDSALDLGKWKRAKATEPPLKATPSAQEPSERSSGYDEFGWLTGLKGRVKKGQ